MTKKSGRNGHKNGNDEKIWAHVLKSVKPYAARPAADAYSVKPPASPTAPPLPRPVAAKKTKNTEGFDRATSTKLKRGQLEIEGRIDLHGMSQEKAFAALSRFVAAAKRKEYRTILVITGKGSLKEGGGILRRQVPLWLKSSDFTGDILAVEQAKPKDGGTGAFYVRLRKSR